MKIIFLFYIPLECELSMFQNRYWPQADANMVGQMWGLSSDEKTFDIVCRTNKSHLIYEQL